MNGQQGDDGQRDDLSKDLRSDARPAQSGNLSDGVIEELRRRKVLRSTTIYAVTGWCLLQWSDYLFEQMGWPDWSVTLVLTVVVLGFPVVVALAWVFDITPQGVRMTSPENLSAGVRTRASWWVDGAVALLFVATIAMLYREGTGL